MSEIAKCPVCGAAIMFLINGTAECFNCPFTCDVEDFPKVSAAMELAKRHKELDNYKGVNPNIVMDLVHDITVAEHYVLEVFK